ncbi:MAG: tRNA (N6-isopentenyl adenosine(37)-C2)-methylthiotransferase MiaB [Spirochaetes bacterium]|nr:tRNA (N6-isopentenyl adenosine(37)-C2)-methylthiotransferase MiaB [Spirochaetota bacterium]
MNKADSNAIINELLENDYIQVDDYNNADIIIINTCSVRITAENRIWGRLGFYKNQKKKKNIVIVIVGCMAQRLGNDFFKFNDTVDIVIGTYQKDNIANILRNYGHDKKIAYIEEKQIKFSNSFPDRDNSKKAFVTISHGCNNFCSYCIVPYVRGREISRSSNEIINDINNLAAKGVIQVTLLGQNVNSYGSENNDISFNELLKRISRETDIKWIKFLSSHPKDFNDDLIEVVAEEGKVANWIHLALQSGSNNVLKKMNRKYTIESFMEKVEKLKRYIPKINLTTDIIVGFPGETENDYLDTYNSLKQIRFDDAYMYKYNIRENTFAQNNYIDDIPEEEKTDRLTQIIDLQRSITRENKINRINDQFEVISECFSKKSENEILGLTKEDLMIIYNGDNSCFLSINKIKAVRLEGNTLYGEKI